MALISWRVNVPQQAVDIPYQPYHFLNSDSILWTMEEWVWYKCPMESSRESPTLEWYQWEVLKLDHSNVFSFCLVMFVGHWRQIIWLDDRRIHVEINVCLLWECLKTPLKQNGTSMSAKNWRHSTICNWKYHRFRDPPHSWTTPPIHVSPGWH